MDESPLVEKFCTGCGLVQDGRKRLRMHGARGEWFVIVHCSCQTVTWHEAGSFINGRRVGQEVGQWQRF